MHKITPHLWYDTEAKAAAELYVSLLPDSKITNLTIIRDTPSGDCDVLSFTLAGQPFMAISAGPLFKLNPSISFHIKCGTVDDVDRMWDQLSPGGTILMELGEYPFSKRFGWLNDRFGLSWQIIFAGENEIKQAITPVLTFTGAVAGRAEEAIKYYSSLFSESGRNNSSGLNMAMRYGKGEEPEREGTLKYASFKLLGLEFGAMDSARPHKFAFNEAISLMVPCDTQEEIDYFWKALSAVPEAEQCGWCKDKFGVSWQVVPAVMNEMMKNGSPEQITRVTRAFLPMKKFDIAKLKQAYAG